MIEILIDHLTVSIGIVGAVRQVVNRWHYHVGRRQAAWIFVLRIIRREGLYR